MERKIQFLESQVEYYDKYLKQCLANLHAAKKKRVHFRTPNNSVFISYIHSDLKCARKFKKSKTINTVESRKQVDLYYNTNLNITRGKLQKTYYAI